MVEEKIKEIQEQQRASEEKCEAAMGELRTNKEETERKLEEMARDLARKVKEALDASDDNWKRRLEEESERLKKAEEKIAKMERRQQIFEQKCDERLREEEKARCDQEAATRAQQQKPASMWRLWGGGGP
eukprot:GHVU01141584.1.p1 GENE.GHVU01141584.1~~GHVU01141584.1.p1  ORF type:complete len:139 (+),score=62.05 GHVU01141584.1:29-418(+)